MLELVELQIRGGGRLARGCMIDDKSIATMKNAIQAKKRLKSDLYSLRV